MAAGDVDVTFTKARALSANVFDGVDDYVEIPHNANQLGANLSNGFTISAWINPRGLGEGSLGRIMEKSSDGNSSAGFYIRLSSLTKIQIRLNTGTAVDSGNGYYDFGVWQHILITFSSGQLVNFFKNGVSFGGTNLDLVQPISAITTTDKLYIGNQRAGASTFDGSIRSVKMWNRVLTTDEITADYQGTTPQSGLIHNFKLGGDYTDYGSVGVTATNSGSLPQVVEDTVAAAIKTQRATAGATGKYLLCSGIKGQVYHTAITE